MLALQIANNALDTKNGKLFQKELIAINYNMNSYRSGMPLISMLNQD